MESTESVVLGEAQRAGQARLHNAERPTRRVRPDRWKVEERNGYKGIDGIRNGKGGTVGNPIIIVASKAVADSLCADLNAVAERHGIDAAMDLHGYLSLIFSKGSAATQRKRFQEYTDGPRDEYVKPDEPKVLGACGYALGCDHPGTVELEIGNTGRTFVSCQCCADLKERFSTSK